MNKATIIKEKLQEKIKGVISVCDEDDLIVQIHCDKFHFGKIIPYYQYYKYDINDIIEEIQSSYIHFILDYYLK